MAQPTTTSGYLTNVQAAFRNVNFGVQVAWQRVVNPNVAFFTIGTSLIGGNDIIKGGGSFVTFFDKFQYSDYSPYVMSWNVQRRLGQYPYGMIMAQADLEFDNTSGLFLPGKDATIGSGILPNRPLKVSVSIGTESLNQFVGFTGQPELSIGDRRMTLHAFDAMDYIERYSFTTSGTTTSGNISPTTSGYLVSQRTDQIIQYYLQQIGFSSNQFVLDQGLQQPIGYVSVADRKLGDVFQALIEAEQGLLFVDENGIVRFWNRQHFLTTSGLGSQFSLNYDNMVSLEYENTPVINDVIVRAKPRSVQSSQKIWDLQSTQEVRAGQKLDLFANFQDDFGDLPVTSVNAPVYISSATSSSFTVNTASDGSGSPSTSLQIIGVYNFGTSYKMTFYNPTSNSLFITALALYGTPARVTTVIEQRFLDQSSIDAYGRNPANNGDPLEISNDYIQDSSTAYSLAYSLVNEYKDPRRRYKSEVFARPELQIGDYGTVTVPDTGEVRSMFLIGNQMTMERDASLKHTVWLEERLPKSYFTIGTSLIGGTDQIAP